MYTSAINATVRVEAPQFSWSFQRPSKLFYTSFHIIGAYGDRAQHNLQMLNTTKNPGGHVSNCQGGEVPLTMQGRSKAGSDREIIQALAVGVSHTTGRSRVLLEAVAVRGHDRGR